MKISEKKQVELDYLIKRCLIFHDFLSKKYYGKEEYYYSYYSKEDSAKLIECYRNVRNTIEEAYKKGNLAVLREGSKDFTYQLREMPFKDVIELGEILKRELGEDLAIVEKQRIAAIKRVVKRGKILNLDEYELLSRRADEIYEYPDMADDLERINSLLVAFHNEESKK